MTIAVPYYGSLIRPGEGIEFIYFLAEVLEDQKGVQPKGMIVWNRRQNPNLSQWLNKEKILGILCHDKPVPLVEELKSAGVWVASEQEGEYPEIVLRWFQEGIQ